MSMPTIGQKVLCCYNGKDHLAEVVEVHSEDVVNINVFELIGGTNTIVGGIVQSQIATTKQEEGEHGRWWPRV